MSGTIDLEVKINTLKAQRSLREMQEDIEEIDKKISEAKWDKLAQVGEPFKNAGIAATAFIGILAGAADQIARFASANERQVVALRGLGSSYQQVQAATAGAVSAQEAFAAQSRLTQSHLRVSSEQLASITRAAREFALRTGTDTTQALNQLTEALANGDQRALRPFGINVQVGTLRTQTFRQALGQLQTAQRGTAASAETLTEAQARLGRAWENFRNDAAAATAETLNLKSAFSELADALTALTDGGPLIHNFFEGILEDITGIQNRRTGTAEDRQRASAVESRITLGRALAARGDLTIDGNINRLSDDQARGLVRIVTDRRLTRDQAQAAIDRAMGVARTVDARARAAGRNGGSSAAQNAADDAAERTRDMSAADWFQLEEDQTGSREQLDILFSDLRQMGFRPRADTRDRLRRNIAGFIDPANRRAFQRAMAQFARLQAREQRLRGLDPNAARMGLSDYDIGGGGRGEFDETFGVLGSAGSRTADGSQSIMERYGSGLSNDQYRQLLESERGKLVAQTEMDQRAADLLKRNDLGHQVGSFFSDTQTLAEKGAKGFENAFNTMSGSVSSFIDTLIEGQVPAGEAAVGLAKAALKGLAMQAVPEALFETAKGFAALAMGDPRASIHFTAAGIYTAVGVAAGAAAAGISAAQRAGQAPSASASMGAGGFTSPGGSNASNERGSVVFNINSTVFDPERAEETVARLMAGANRRGL